MSNLSAVTGTSTFPAAPAQHNSTFSKVKIESILPDQSNAALPITDHKVQEIKTIVESEKQKLENAEKDLESARSTFTITSVISVAVTIACIAIAILLPTLTVALSWLIGLGGLGLSLVAMTVAARRVNNAEACRDEILNKSNLQETEKVKSNQNATTKHDVQDSASGNSDEQASPTTLKSVAATVTASTQKEKIDASPKPAEPNANAASTAAIAKPPFTPAANAAPAAIPTKLYAKPNVAAAPITTAAAVTAIDALKETLADSVARVKIAMAGFTHRLHCVLLADKEWSEKSFAISTPSIYFALGMLLKAIPEGKKAEYLKVLGIENMSEARFHEALADILKKIEIRSSKKPGDKITPQDQFIQFVNAMAIKTDKTELVAPEYLVLVKDQYSGDLRTGNDVEVQVNTWVKEKTFGLIPKLLEPKKATDDETIVAFVNAAIVALPWKKTFDFNDIERGVFELSDGKKVEGVLIMNQEFSSEDCIYYKGTQDENFDMLELPYKSGASRVIFVPHRPEELAKIELELTSERIKEIRQTAQTQKKLRFDDLAKRRQEAAGKYAQALKEYEEKDGESSNEPDRPYVASGYVKVKYPMKKIESSFPKLLDGLKQMQLPLDDLDLAMIKDPTAYIESIVHKTHVVDDKDGTVAATTTAVIVVLDGYGGYKAPDFVFNAARPHFDCIMSQDVELFRTRVNDDTALVKRTKAEWAAERSAAENNRGW
jgi:serine protease inhibitor